MGGREVSNAVRAHNDSGTDKVYEANVNKPGMHELIALLLEEQEKVLL